MISHCYSITGNGVVSFISQSMPHWLSPCTINRRRLPVGCWSYWMLIHWQCTTCACVHSVWDAVSLRIQLCSRLNDSERVTTSEMTAPRRCPTSTSIMPTWEATADRVGGRGLVFWVLSCNDGRHGLCSCVASRYSSSSPRSVCGQHWSVVSTVHDIATWHTCNIDNHRLCVTPRASLSVGARFSSLLMLNVTCRSYTTLFHHAVVARNTVKITTMNKQTKTK